MPCIVYRSSESRSDLSRESNKYAKHKNLNSDTTYMTVIGKVTFQFKLEFALRFTSGAGFIKKSLPINLTKDFVFRLDIGQHFAKGIVATNFGIIGFSLPFWNHRVGTGR